MARPTPRDCPPLPPDRLLAGRYKVGDYIAGGGFGCVFEAIDTRKSRTVAVKLLRPKAANDLRWMDRFRREVQIARDVNNPNVLPVLDYGHDSENDLYWYVTRRLRTDLSKVAPLELDVSIDLLRRIAWALDELHQHQDGFVHRDVKPENILLDVSSHGGFHPFLADFGVAKARTQPLTGRGRWLGDVRYAAPEQRTGGDKLTGAADQYALATTLWFCLLGCPPFDFRDDDTRNRAHRKNPRPKLSEHNFPTEMDHVLAGGMAIDPEDRYPTCQEFMNAAADAAGVHRPTLTLPPEPDDPATELMSGSAGGLPSRRRRPRALALAALGMLMLVTLAVLILDGSDGRDGKGQTPARPADRVLDTAANVRAAPSVRSARLGSLEPATEIVVACRAHGPGKNTEIDWARLQEPQEYAGRYVSMGLLQLEQKPPPCWRGRVADTPANVREQPSVDSTRRGSLEPTTQIVVACQSRGPGLNEEIAWARLQEPQEFAGGFVSMGLIELSEQPPECLSLADDGIGLGLR